MNVTAPKDQFSPCLTPAATSSDQSGNFLSTNVTATDAEEHMEDLQTSAHGTQLCNRIIYPFKAILSTAAFAATTCTALGLIPSSFVFCGAVLTTGVAGAGVGLMLGSMTALAKRSREYVVPGIIKGEALGTLLGVAIGVPSALITTATVAAGSFIVATPLFCTLLLPGAIYQAGVMSNAEIYERELVVKNVLQSQLSNLIEAKDLLSNAARGLTASARTNFINPHSRVAYQYRY